MRWFLAAALTSIWGYLATVMFYGTQIAGVMISGTVLVCLIIVGAVALSLLAQRLSDGRQKDLLASCLSLLVALLLVDTGYTVWVNRSAEVRLTQGEARLSDPHVWHGELFPRSYYPSDQTFSLYKPNVRVEGLTYGEFYEPAMLESPTLVHDVLRLRPLVYTIDENGLRNRVSIHESRLWALGDSFAMGYATTEGLTWTDRFAELTGRPVYNVGVSGTGPGLQVQALEHLLRRVKDVVAPERVLWMIFEGNDLENSYEEQRRLPRQSTSYRTLLADTIITDVFSSLTAIRRRSIIGRVLDGQMRISLPGSTPENDPYLIEGIPVATPVYRSERWGYCMFNPQDIERATRDERYVQDHPNRPLFERSVERMKQLAEEFGFQVLVTVAPSAPRMYGRDFPEMPQPTAVPHFIRYAEDLAGRAGFETIDLLGALSTEASPEMLYYCDDHHWNERGNDVVARVLADRL